MKKIVKYIFLMLLLLPVLVSASNYRDAVDLSNNLLHDKYTVYNYEDFLYSDKADLLSKEEYKISLKNDKIINTTSYLAFGERYWTSSKKSDNEFYAISGAQDKEEGVLGLSYSNIDNNLSTRATEMVLPETTVTGTGTMSDPWVFVTKYKLELEYEQDKVEKVSVNGTEISNTDIKCNKGICVAYAGRYKAECDSETKECTANVELKLKAPNIYVSNNCGGILQDNGIIKIGKLIRNTKCNLKLGTGKFKVRLSNKFGNIEATTKASPNPVYLYYGENFYKDSEYKTPIYNLDTKPVLNGYNFNGYTYNNIDIIDSNGKFINTKEAKTAIKADDLELTIKYDAQKVKINFNANDTDDEQKATLGATTKTYTYGEKYTGLPSAIRNGFIFDGWYSSATNGNKVDENTEVKETGERTLYAHWRYDKYEMKFDANGGKFSNNSTVYTLKQDYKSNITAPSNPTRTGFIFDGWDKTVPTTMPIGGATLNAKWKDTAKPTSTLATTSSLKVSKQTSTLTCKDGAGVVAYYFGTKSSPGASDYTTITSNTNFSTTKEVSSAGTYYLFCKDNAGNISDSKNIVYQTYKVDNMLLNTTGDTYTTTHYIKVGNTLTYLAPKNTTITLTSVYTIPSHSRAGRFKGASTGAASTTAATVSKDNPKLTTNNTTYTMWFSRNLIYFQYKVLSDETLKKGSDTTYTWSKDSDNFLVRTTSDNSSSNKFQAYRYGTAQINLYNNSASGHFQITKSGKTPKSGAEWACVSGCATGVTAITEATTSISDTDTQLCNTTSNDCTIVLKTNWVNAYAITYNKNTTDSVSSMPDNQTKEHAVDIKLSTNTPTRTGYTFSGWNTKDNGSGTSYAAGATYKTNAALTLYAQWTAKTYTVSYIKNTTDSVSNMPSNQTKTYGADLTLSNNTPTRTGFTFTGWNTKADGKGTSYAKGATYKTNAALTLYAQWTPSKVFTYIYTKASKLKDGTGNEKTIAANTQTDVIGPNWYIKLDSDGQLTIKYLNPNKIDIFAVGGGGGGGKGNGGGGGGGYRETKSGYTPTLNKAYTITIGSGGASDTAGSATSVKLNSSAILSANGGGAGAVSDVYGVNGGTGGSNGGASTRKAGNGGSSTGGAGSNGAKAFGDNTIGTELYGAGGGGSNFYANAETWVSSEGKYLTTYKHDCNNVVNEGGTGGTNGGGTGGNSMILRQTWHSGTGSVTAETYCAVKSGTNATFYGAGGGGGSISGSNVNKTYNKGGSGYKGIVIIRNTR